VREWFPALACTRLNQPTWPEIERERSEVLVGVVPASVIHQRLVDEEGLEASVASLRRWLRAHFADEVRPGEVDVWRTAGRARPKPRWTTATWAPGPDPAGERRRRIWAFSMVPVYSRHLFVYPVAVCSEPDLSECRTGRDHRYIKRGWGDRLAPEVSARSS
jgi:hypothetical protein